MIPIVEVAKGIFRIGPLETGTGTSETSPYLVVGSARAAIIEPGEGGQAPPLLEVIGGNGEGQLGMDLNRIAYLIATHIHLHHIRGVNTLLKAIPRAKMVVHQRGVPHLIDPTRLNASTAQVWGEGTGCAVPIPPVPQDRIMGVAGGEVFDLGGRELEIIETTGHAPHHISILDRLTKVLWPGDAMGVLRLGKERARPDILPPLFDLDKAVDSLHRLRALKPAVLMLFGYGGVSFSPDKTLQWSEEDIRAVERICREGMKKKMSNQEINQKVQEHYKSVGVADPTQREGGGAPGGGNRGGSMAGPYGMYAYIKRQDPSLEIPQ